MNSLNPQQMEAVKHRSGPMMVLAGPGSGKTTMITHRVIYMTQQYGISEERILVLTYTKAAAREMRGRFLRLSGTDHTKVTFGTFHSVFWKMLREQGHFRDYEIMEEEEALHIGIDIIKREWSLPTAEARELLTERKMTQEQYRIWKDQYEEYKRIWKRMDYEDILEKTEVMLQEERVRAAYQRRFSFLMVDEFQDVNPRQYRIIGLLAGRDANVFVVGDDDQAIYGFRGASPGIMLRFPKDYPGCRVIQLKWNYRSTRQIVEFSARVIVWNRERYDKQIQALEGREGGKVQCRYYKNAAAECRAIIGYARRLERPEDLAVLFRTAYQADPLRRMLEDYGMAYQMREYCPSPYEHWIGEDIADFWRAAQGNGEAAKRLICQCDQRIPAGIFTWLEDSDRLEDLLNFSMSMEVRTALEEWLYELRHLLREKPEAGMRRILRRLGYREYLYSQASRLGIDEKELLQRLAFWKGTVRNCETWEAWEGKRIRGAYQKNQGKGIHLMTLHASKGLEFPAVWIPALEKGNLPHERAADIEEERRLFYVGCTRAKHQLILSRAGKKEASCFWREISEDQK